MASFASFVMETNSSYTHYQYGILPVSNSTLHCLFLHGEFLERMLFGKDGKVSFVAQFTSY